MIPIGQARLIILAVAVIYLALGTVFGYIFVWSPNKAVTRYEAEIKDALKTVKQKPNDIGARINLGFKYMKTQKFDEAKAEYNAALQIDPNNRVAILNMAYFFLETKNYKEADKYLENLNKTDPGFQVYFMLGKSKFMQKDFNAAIQKLQFARDLDPTDTETHYYMGLSYLKTGEKDKAAEEFKEALQFDPNRRDAIEELKKMGISYKSEVKGH